MSVMQVIIHKFEVFPSSPLEDMAHFRSQLIGLETLTFDFLTAKWRNGSPISWSSLLPIFSLLCPSILDLGSDTGQ